MVQLRQEQHYFLLDMNALHSQIMSHLEHMVEHTQGFLGRHPRLFEAYLSELVTVDQTVHVVVSTEEHQYVFLVF